MIYDDRGMIDQSITLAGKAGHEIAASVDGPELGLPVILAHGGGQTRRAWRAVAHRLASHGFRTIAVDMRGHGESAWASDGAYDIRSEEHTSELQSLMRTSYAGFCL